MAVTATSVRLFFELPPAEDFDSYWIKIYESDSPQDPGTLIDKIRITPELDYVDTEQAGSSFSWFVLEIANEDESSSVKSSEPVLGERAYTKIQSIRDSVNDTGVTPAFTDTELMYKMRLAAMRLNGVQNLTSIQEKYWPIIELLVRIDICNVLAFDYAKYTRLEIPGGPSLEKDELYQHYIEVAKSLEEYYSKIKIDTNRQLAEAGDGAGDDVRVTTAKRDSYQSGLEETTLEPSLYLDSQTLDVDYRRRLTGLGG